MLLYRAHDYISICAESFGSQPPFDKGYSYWINLLGTETSRYHLTHLDLSIYSYNICIKSSSEDFSFICCFSVTFKKFSAIKDYDECFFRKLEETGSILHIRYEIFPVIPMEKNTPRRN